MERNVNTLTDKYMTVAEAASLAKRSRPVIYRWIHEGWIPGEHVYALPVPNTPWLIDRSFFKQQLPCLLEQMSQRKGGRGNKATNAAGLTRGA